MRNEHRKSDQYNPRKKIKLEQLRQDVEENSESERERRKNEEPVGMRRLQHDDRGGSNVKTVPAIIYLATEEGGFSGWEPHTLHGFAQPSQGGGLNDDLDKCQEKIVCPRCSGEHDVKECKNNIACCSNCVRWNEKMKTNHATGHHSTNSDCPVLKHHLNVIRSKTDYFSDE
ncbi:hypothetical protein HHI36_014180 [Cryptolaemus montrouzieri]|uniref:Uncharacterized protein n=1 Tax=Cryptolaemus montrouzieri TaxID=559131 RepID=A0ABD2N1R3_9CUCU